MNLDIEAIINDLTNNNINNLEQHNNSIAKREDILASVIKLEKIKIFNVPTVMKNFNGICGLYYIKNYLSMYEINNIKNFINDSIELKPISANNYSRRVAHFGYFYSYDRTGLKEAPAIPNILQELANNKYINKLLDADIVPQFDQLIINEYQKNQQIAYHTDHKTLFGPVIACITIGQVVPIYFKNGDQEIKLNIEEGSMYIMTGDARYIWQHSLKNNCAGVRYSLTYRTVVKN